MYDSLGRLWKVIDPDGVTVIGQFGYDGGKPGPVFYQVQNGNVRWITDQDRQWILDHVARIDDSNFGETEFNAMMAEFDAQWQRGGANAPPVGVLATEPPLTHDACIAQCDSFWMKVGMIACPLIGIKFPPYGAICGVGAYAADQLCKQHCPPPDNAYEYIWCRKTLGSPFAPPYGHPELCGPDPVELITADCNDPYGPIVYPGPIDSQRSGLLRHADCYYVAPNGLPEWVHSAVVTYWVICGNGLGGDLADAWGGSGINDPQQLAQRICNR